MKRDIILVKLPKVENVEQDFFGIGYFSDNGFVFSLLTEDICSSNPLRIIPYPVHPNEMDIKIIGKIKNIQSP